MKNFFKFLGIISLVLVIGFSMASCEEEDDSDDNSSSSSSSGGGATWGLTIINIPAEITGFITADCAGEGSNHPGLYFYTNDTFVASASYAKRKAAPIANGKAMLNVYTYSAKYTGSNAYNSNTIGAEVGNHQFRVLVVNTETPFAEYGGIQNSAITARYKLQGEKVLQFTNGVATLDWNDLEVTAN